jgi:hypothetical protein
MPYRAANFLLGQADRLPQRRIAVAFGRWRRRTSERCLLDVA